MDYYEFITQFIPPDTNYNWRDYSAMGRVGFDRVHADLRVHKMVDLLRNDVGPRRMARYFDKLATPAEGNEGKLTLLQFIGGMEHCGYKISSRQWNHLLEIIDKDKSGFISRDEFCFSFGTDEGNREILNGPGDDNSEGFDQFFKVPELPVRPCLLYMCHVHTSGGFGLCTVGVRGCALLSSVCPWS